MSLLEPIPSYYILDGKSRTYDCREEIKNWAGYWNKEMKCWQIDNPDETCKNVLKQAGLILQFAKNI